MQHAALQDGDNGISVPAAQRQPVLTTFLSTTDFHCFDVSLAPILTKLTHFTMSYGSIHCLFRTPDSQGVTVNYNDNGKKCLMILLLAFDFAGAGGESGEPRLRQRAVTPAPAMKVRVR